MLARVGFRHTATNATTIQSTMDVHEVIRGRHPHRLVIDLDAPQTVLDRKGHKRDDITYRLFESMAHLVNELIRPERVDWTPRYFACASSSDATRLSLHVSIPNVLLADYAEAGVRRVMLQHLLHDDLDAVALIGREVIPRVAAL